MRIYIYILYSRVPLCRPFSSRIICWRCHHPLARSHHLAIRWYTPPQHCDVDSPPASCLNALSCIFHTTPSLTIRAACHGESWCHLPTTIRLVTCGFAPSVAWFLLCLGFSPQFSIAMLLGGGGGEKFNRRSWFSIAMLLAVTLSSPSPPPVFCHLLSCAPLLSSTLHA